jgi:hypothetical protein
MKTTISALVAATCAFALAAQAFAHGDAPHPKCKKGYVAGDDHRCVKKD